MSFSASLIATMTEGSMVSSSITFSLTSISQPLNATNTIAAMPATRLFLCKLRICLPF